MKNNRIVVNSFERDIIQPKTFTLIVELLNDKSLKKNSRTLKIENTINFDTYESLIIYSKKNNIDFDTKDIITDKRTGDISILGKRYIKDEIDLENYYKKLQSEIDKLKK